MVHRADPGIALFKGPGKVGLPIQIGGLEVETGDMVVGDRDGVVIVPFERIDEVIERLARIQALETELDAKVADGLKVFGWAEEVLASDQVAYID